MPADITPGTAGKSLHASVVETPFNVHLRARCMGSFDFAGTALRSVLATLRMTTIAEKITNQNFPATGFSGFA
jgi:hypothetical protein